MRQAIQGHNYHNIHHKVRAINRAWCMYLLCVSCIRYLASCYLSCQSIQCGAFMPWWIADHRPSMPSWSKDGVVSYSRDFVFFFFKFIVVTNLKIDFHHCIYYCMLFVCVFGLWIVHMYIRLKWKSTILPWFYYTAIHIISTVYYVLQYTHEFIYLLLCLYWMYYCTNDIIDKIKIGLLQNGN